MLSILVLATVIGCAYSQFYDICENKPFGTFIKDYTSCKSYIACTDNHSTYGDCPTGFLFNEENGLCDFADNVKCQVCPPIGLQNIPMLGSCDKFVRCINGVGSYVKCSEGLFFDKNLGTCNIRDEVDCEQDICENGDGLVASHEDCAAYFDCYNGKATRKECPKGMYYSSSIKRCDKKENVPCSIQSPKEEEVTDVDIICPPTGLHYYPHPNNCGHYYICLNGVSAAMNCGPVLKYDYIQKKCVLPHNASCIVSVL